MKAVNITFPTAVFLVLCLVSYAAASGGNTVSGANQAQDLANPASRGEMAQPQPQTPSVTGPAQPPATGQNPAATAEPPRPASPGTAAKPQPSSGTQPAQPATSGAPSSTSADPADKNPAAANTSQPPDPGKNPAAPAQPGDKNAQDIAGGDKGQPGNAGKTKADNVDNNQPAGNSKDETDTDDKNKDDSSKKADNGEKNAPDDNGNQGDKGSGQGKADHGNKGGKSGPGRSGGSKGLSLPGSTAGHTAAAATGAGVLGALFGGGGKDGDKTKPVPAPADKTSGATVVSTVAAAGSTAVSTSAVTGSTVPAVAEPLFSEGKGPKIAVLDFTGDDGGQFTALLVDALKPELKVYSRALSKTYAPAGVNRVSAKKIGAKMGVAYIVTGKIDKKTDTLTIIVVYLRSASTGDIRMTDFIQLRDLNKLPAKAAEAAKHIEGRI